MTHEPGGSTGPDGPTVTIGRVIEGRITFSAPVVATDDSGYVRLPMLVEQQGLSVASTIELGTRIGQDPGGSRPSWLSIPVRLTWRSAICAVCSDDIERNAVVRIGLRD